MRTTITFADDVAAGIERVRREQGLELSEAVNDLVRAGLVPRERPPFRQKTYSMGRARIDYSNVAEAIEEIEGPLAR